MEYCEKCGYIMPQCECDLFPRRKSISWYALHKRIGKQTMHKTRNTKVQVLLNGELRECALVFTNNGSDFHLEIVR